MKLLVKMKILRWLCLLEDTTNLLLNVIKEWGEEILEEIDSEMILQKITKSHVLVVSNLDT